MKGKNIFFIMLLTLVCSSFAFADDTLNNVLWASGQDASVSDYDIYGGVTGVAGVVDGAFEFGGGASYLNTLYTPPSSSSPFSISTWIKKDALGTIEGFLSTSNSASRDGIVQYIDVNNKLVTLILDNNLGVAEMTSTTAITANEWYNIVLTYDGTNAIMYINGNNEGSDSSATFATHDHVLKLGEFYPSYGSREWTGEMDETKVFDKDLTQTEIDDLYNAGVPEVNEVAKANEVFYANMDSLYDYSDNLNDLSGFNGVTYDATGNAMDFDGVSDYLSGTITGDNSYTISQWVNFDTLSGTTYISQRRNVANNANYGFSQVAGKLRLQSYDGGVFTIDSTTALSVGQWYMLTAVVDGANSKIYIDGGLDTSGTLATFTSGDDLWIGQSGTSSAYLDAQLSGIVIYPEPKDITFISALYAEGRDYNPYEVAPTPEGTPESTESTAIVKQTSPVDVNTPTLTTVFASTYEVLNDSTELYGEYNFNVLSNLNNSVYCEIQIDGVAGATVTRTNTVGKLGSISLMTPHFSQDAGNYTQALLCSKIGAGKVTVSNGIGIGHFLRDEQDEVIPHDSLTLSSTVTSGSTYTNFGGINFTVSNKTSDTVLNNIVIEWAGTYENNAGTEEILSTYINISGAICSAYPRTVEAGGSGSVGGDCLLKNATTNQTYEISFYGNGTNADYAGNLIIKELFLSTEEISGGQGALVGEIFTGDTNTSLVVVEGGNLHHDLANVFQKQSYSILTDEDTTVTMFIVMTDGDSFQTVDMTRSFEAGKIGVLTGHDIFENTAPDNYTLEVFANCGSPTATCEIMGGAGIGYITDVTTTVFQGFTIDAYDLWTDTPLLELTATNGVTFSTTTGTIDYFTTESTVDFTLAATDGAGYISQEYTNYDTSNNLSAGMAQSQIEIIYKTIFSNQTVSSFTVTDTIEGGFSTTNGSLIMYPNFNTYAWDITAAGYFDLLDYPVLVENQSQQIIIQEASDAQLTVTLTDLTSALAISNYTINLTSLDYDYQETLSTTTGTMTFEGLENGEYNLFIDAAGYAYNNVTLNVSAGSNPVDYDMFRTNTINISFYDETTKALLTGVEVSMELISEQGSYNYTTLTGNVFEELLSPSGYNIKYSADGYNTRYYYFELVDRTSTTIDLYLLNATASDTITVSVVDENAQEVAGALVKVLKFDVPTSTYILQQSLSTDADGEVQFSVEFNENFYYFVVEYPIGTQLAQTTPALIFKSTLLIQINLGGQGGTGWTTRDDITSSIVYYRDTAEFVFKYNDAQNTAASGCLYVYDDKYNSSSLIASGCASGPVNTVTVSVPGTNGSYYQAKGFVEISGSPILVAIKQVIIPIGSVFDFNALFLVAVLVLAFAMTAIKTGPAAVLVLPVLGLAFARMAGILSNYLTWGVVASLLAVSIILSFIVKRRFF